MGASSLDNTRGSVFSAVSVNSMRLSDKWVCDSVALHHMTANKQYIATYKRFQALVNILLAYAVRFTILDLTSRYSTLLNTCGAAIVAP